LLPAPLRAPIGLAYLLARASDTIADSTAVPVAARLRHLAAFWQMIRTGEPDGIEELRHEITSPHDGECTLIACLGDCLNWLADLRAGRCYFPEPELRAAGTSPTRLGHDPAKAQPVFDLWRKRAAAYLGDGYRYIEALRSPRLRAGCFLPWYLGMKTLALMEK